MSKVTFGKVPERSRFAHFSICTNTVVKTRFARRISKLLPRGLSANLSLLFFKQYHHMLSYLMPAFAAALVKFAIYIDDRPAGNYLSPRGSLSHQDFCNLFCLAFSARNQRKSSYFVLVKLSARAGTLFLPESGCV